MQEQFKVEGMTCQHCARSVEEAIEDLDPAARVAVDLPSGRVDVTASTQPREALRQAIEGAGYRAA